ncbi:reverse transcriptase [Plakobranchus ocellatus]|uniref:Reverse transcriptase n=1 Tax=Plakobranchus ocellatus TaxID=259542 RepID=A0AAV4CZN0_9GAST|nr:reverse transcriptase [Plakobranchus ocellatus]
MEVTLRAAEGGASPTDLSGGCYMPSLSAFMDDITKTRNRRMLIRLDALLNWSRINSKPKKYQSLAIRKLDEDVCFKLASEDMLKISQESTNSLGRWHDSSLKDTKYKSET